MVRHAYPPQFVVENKPISADEAQRALASYLEKSESKPSMHPDALLSTSGVHFASAGGPQGGIILHNLRRVDAALRGELLKPEVPDYTDGMDIDGVGAAYEITAGAQQGQDRDEWEREQEGVDDQGTTTFVADGAEAPEVAVEDSTKVDKDARKKAKKERERQLKIEKERKKREQADA